MTVQNLVTGASASPGLERRNAMTFLEANRLISAFEGGPELEFRFAMSSTPDPFRLYLEAAGARQGYSVVPRFLPFNTLGQALAGAAPSMPEVFLILPWDLIPEADWRSGVPATRADSAALVAAARDRAKLFRNRPNARFLYLPAPIPPLSDTPAADAATLLALDGIAAELGAHRLPAEAFSLGAYFASGCPVRGPWLGAVATAAIAELCETEREPCKVLVTDLDGVLWAGVVADDGIDGVAFAPEGRGYRHFAYQTLLARLRGEGTLLAAVSRNDADVAREPLRAGHMTLREDDFVAIMASYHPKSAQIRELARQLNLGLNAFVFVDDNPVELSEVGQLLPDVTCIEFPQTDEGMPALFTDLCSRFARRELTAEDRERTALYRRRLEGIAPVDAEGADLTAFLAGLEMRLTVHDRSSGDRTRAVQLINKTNQFNLNGRRWTDEEVAGVLASGGRLLTAALSDRTGTHGEILALLVSHDGVVEAFVMSCRVFQRRVEHAFLCTLQAAGITPTAMRLARTPKNGPFLQFAEDVAFEELADGLVSFDAGRFAGSHGDVLRLFQVDEQLSAVPC
jgi:FkbH-like protein